MPRHAKSRNADLRNRIVQVALDLVERQGVDRLTQPQLARAVGIRQSHLTYYFPRRADLFAAVLDESHRRACGPSTAGTAQGVGAMLQQLSTDPIRIRFFLDAVLALSKDAELRVVLRAHSDDMRQLLADYFGREADDPDLEILLCCMRGAGIGSLEAAGPAPRRLDILAVARRLGLTPARL